MTDSPGTLRAASATSCPATSDPDDDDEACWNNLENFRVKLISVIDPTRITPYLRQCKVINHDDEEQILNDPSLVIRKRKTGVLLDILQRTGRKGFVALLESLELYYPLLYKKITGNEPTRVFSAIIDAAGESSLTELLMSEVSKLQGAIREEKRKVQELNSLLQARDTAIKEMRVRDNVLRKHQERGQKLKEEKDHLSKELKQCKDENYELAMSYARQSEEKNAALMKNRDLQLEIDCLKHSLMKAQDDCKIERKQTLKLRQAMAQRPSHEAVWEIQREKDLLLAKNRELESTLQHLVSSFDDHIIWGYGKPANCMKSSKRKWAMAWLVSSRPKRRNHRRNSPDAKVTKKNTCEKNGVSIQALEAERTQMLGEKQELVNAIYNGREALRRMEEIRDKLVEEKELLELKCTSLQNDAQIYQERSEAILRQMEEVAVERDQALLNQEGFHKQVCRGLRDKDAYRKQIRELAERCDELQLQLFQKEGQLLRAEAKLKQRRFDPSALTSDFEETSSRSSQELTSQGNPDEDAKYADKTCSDTQDHQSNAVDKTKLLQSPTEGSPVDGEPEPAEKGRRRIKEGFEHYRRKWALRRAQRDRYHGVDWENSSGSDNTDTEGS